MYAGKKNYEQQNVKIVVYVQRLFKRCKLSALFTMTVLKINGFTVDWVGCNGKSGDSG